MAGDVDWSRVGIEAAGSLVSGLGGLLFGVWRLGRRSAQREHNIRADCDSQIGQLGSEMRTAMAAVEKSSEDRVDLLVDQFKESFVGLRRQIDDDRLHTEQNFLRKDDFRDFREEYREDMRDLKRRIDSLPRTP